MEYVAILTFVTVREAVKRFFLGGYFIPVFGLLGCGYLLGKLF